MEKKRNILITSALPYANGPIHLGHLVEYIQTDIWVRFQKLCGNNCYYMCADDAHGTPIMLSAKKQNITPEELIDKTHKEHLDDFSAFLIDYDNYYSTNSPENKELAEFIFSEAKKQGAIYEKEIEQMYCPNCTIFLPDRFIRGTCPKCNAEDQYGDSCEECSAAYSPKDLGNPKCAECGSIPVLKKTSHFFFKLSTMQKKLEDWVSSGHVKDEIKNKLKEWFSEGLRDWDITRDAPYFGFKIPGTEDKYFYVWLDAPIGYIATTKNWCKKNNMDFDAIWRKGDYEIHHVIGKDIIYFHTLFWPAMLMVSGFSLPNKVHIHGFLKINGQKMSKSRGTFITAQDYIKHVDPELLRYYYAAKLSSSIEDIDLNFEDFVNTVNSNVINKVVNIASRTGSIMFKKLDAKLTSFDEEGKKLIKSIQDAESVIKDCYENFEYSKATREIMALADKANKYIDTKTPWAVVNDNPELAGQICTTGLNAFRLLICYLKPIIPMIAQKAEEFLNISPLVWEDLKTALLDHTINKYQHLVQRIDLSQVEKIGKTN
ncbi:methionine--tRNA ligase [Candidatus Margulisiibacteriota bacterium]